MFILKFNDVVYQYKWVSSTYNDIIESMEYRSDDMACPAPEFVDESHLLELQNIEEDVYISRITMRLIDFLNINYVNLCSKRSFLNVPMLVVFFEKKIRGF